MYRFGSSNMIGQMNDKESELVLNADGSVYHLKLKSEHIANNVILVGDPGRVEMISAMFDQVEHRVSNREFVTHTGYYKGKRVTALATGIGTDNIDIVANELDAAINFDPVTRQVKPNLRQLNLIRIGTCGSLQKDLAVDSPVITAYSIGLDGLQHFYEIASSEIEINMARTFKGHMALRTISNEPYASACSAELLDKFKHFGSVGITLTANGFFGPQGRALRIPLKHQNFNDRAADFTFGDWRILNYEMESSALYALGKALDHNCLCICLVVANRKAGTFSKNYQIKMEQLIRSVLDNISD